MSKRDPKALTDGFSSVTLGVNSGLAPISIPRNQMAWAINATFRNGYAEPRPGVAKLPLTFLDEDGNTDDDLQNHFSSYTFMGASSFERRNQLVLSIGGRLFAINLDTLNVTDISTIDLNPSNRYRSWFAEAEDWLIIQDGQSAAWIYDGASTLRSDPLGSRGPKQVPTGTAMVYSTGRLDVALLDNRQFVVGDIVGGDSGTVAYQFRDAVLYFTENDVINGGGAFSVPMSAGLLTAFRPIAQVDTSTGQGPTQVFTTGGIFSLNTPTDRTQWATTNFPIGTVSMVSSGATSDRATVNVNGDLWMRSLDGIRSFLVARRDFTTWVNAPMSQEMVRALSSDDRNLLSYASAALFDNRLLVTCNPYRLWGRGIAHRGLAVIDFAPVAYLNQRSNPVWEGLWTGLQVLQIVSGIFRGIERCFIVAINSSNQIEVWELSKSDVGDDTGSGVNPITWQLESGALTFPRTPDPGPGQFLVSLDGGRLYVDDLQGDVTFATAFKPDQAPCWTEWHSWDICATQNDCADQACTTTPPNLQPQYRKPFFLPNPAASCDPVVNKYSKTIREMQVRLTITGQARVKRLELTAHDMQEDITDKCAQDEECEQVSCCQDDWSVYRIPGSGEGTGRIAPPFPVPEPIPVPTKVGEPIQILPTPPLLPPPSSVGEPVPYPPDPPYTPPTEDPGTDDTPLQCAEISADPTCWMLQYSNVYLSNYGVTRTSDLPSDDGIDAAMTTFWKDLLIQEYTDLGVDVPANGQWIWSYVDDYSGYAYDFMDQYNNPSSDPVYFQPGSFWRLGYLVP